MARTDPRPHYGTKRRQRTDGYIDVYEPQHPLARQDGYVAEHRRMAWDAGLFTDPSLQVHHINEIKTDNRLDNFEIKTAQAHALEHAEERGWVRNQFGAWQVKPPERRIGAPRPERPCGHCGATISLAKRRDAKYCSQQCNMRAFKARRRDA